MDEMDEPRDTVLDAYLSLGEGDPSGLIDVLDPEIEWYSAGAVHEVGRDAVARRLRAAAGGRIELVGVRRVGEMFLLEFTRPWWKGTDWPTTAVRSLFGIRGEQAVYVSNGRVTRIESRESVPLANA
jgi:hypothetical protein